MAKHIIVFDDNDKGCCLCPYYKFRNTRNSSEKGYYCTKQHKLVRREFDSEQDIPSWCDLEEFKENSENTITVQSNSLETTKFVSQIHLGSYVLHPKFRDKLYVLQSTKRQIAMNIADNLLLNDKIQYQTLTRPEGIIVRGELEIVKNT